MAKPKASEKPVTPGDEVRYTGLMTRVERARFKAFCETRGLDMERVGTQWILERLAAEEKRHKQP